MDKEREKKIKAALSGIEKEHGKGAVLWHNKEDFKLDVSVISTGLYSLDSALGVGGLPRGRVVEIYGPEMSGKTTIALGVAAEAQKAGGVVAFIDAEHAFDPIYAAKNGVDVDDLIFSQPDCGEQGIDTARKLMNTGEVDVIIIDSVAALVPKKELDGDIGDANVGLQARLMSQSLRILTSEITKSNTCLIFINQLREKVGVMFGCFNYSSRVTLADGTQEKIGKIVNNKMPLEVLAYDAELGKVVPRKIVNWFDNGNAEYFLQFIVDRRGGNGRSSFACTPNHSIMTPAGWVEAQNLGPGDVVLQAVPKKLSDTQMEIVRGTLMGDGCLSMNSTKLPGTARLRMGHCLDQEDYLDWKIGLFQNVHASISRTERAKFCDFASLPELWELRNEVYKEGKKYFSQEYLDKLTPRSLALWYMDDASFVSRAKTKESGRISICVEAMTPDTRERLNTLLNNKYGMNVQLKEVGERKQTRLIWDAPSSTRFQELIAPFVHPSMEYKLLPAQRGKFEDVELEYTDGYTLVETTVQQVYEKPPTRSMRRFDIEVEAAHCYFVDGVLVHNSPETTPGGKALKFYSSVRLDVRRIGQLKGKNEEVVGGRTRVKVVKNKVAPPFRKAEFDILFTEGVSKMGDLVDTAVEAGIIKKSGAWYNMGETKLGQGRENAKDLIREDEELRKSIADQLTALYNVENDPATTEEETD